MTNTPLDFEKVLEFLRQKLASMRSGRINGSLLENIYVEAYGSRLKINELATVTSPEPAQLLITPFDKSVLNAIEKAVRDSDLGVNPVNDGAGLRLVFPPLTEENKRKRVKDISIMLEEARIMLRNLRHEQIKSIKSKKEAGELSEDEVKREETEVQKIVDDTNKKLELLAKAKEEEIMKI